MYLEVVVKDIPGWSQKIYSLYDNYFETRDQEIADQLLYNLNAANQKIGMKLLKM